MSLITKPSQPAQPKRAENPKQDSPSPAERRALDELTEHAIRESKAEKTISLREYAVKHHVTLHDE